MARKRRYDLREFWPSYERSYPTPEHGGPATPPPFTLADIAKKDDRPMRGQRVFQLLCLVGAVALVGFVVWGFRH